MTRFVALLGKELRTFFASPLVYFVTGVFLALSGYYFYTDLNALITFGFGENIVEHLWQRVYNDVVKVLITAIPLITMRVYSVRGDARGHRAISRDDIRDTAL